ncbi:P-loop containing nucleoside triphosphate hydrolase protein [Radiomyces spectabilis]|uniref:P-loop containing nucleoside triphosphate hydrolase protein n=1 Tax=Radiomyces spectabilis TaxID=64574 RepID=UPI002220F2FC|nr:P-loop containing nucleoside triphosphate hydrolase protein [Radiomyces spectabilis]KAI8368158.1 P-loop containing nucleoside triphosphate hydrolase protein [Radiomyces spectabilis]
MNFLSSVQSVRLGVRTFSCTSVALSKRAQLKKPNISTLTKHLKPDGMTGRERRNMLKDKLKNARPKSKSLPYVPVKKRLETIQPTLSQLPTQNVRELSKILADRTFADLGLSPTMLSAVRDDLKHIDDPRPTEIQALSIPQLLERKNRHVLCAAETGSGKTLAYLVPIIECLKIDEQKGVKRRLDHPRAIVLVPTRELVGQVLKTCKSLSHKAKFRSMALSGRTPRHQLVEKLADGPIDILITTPTTLMSYVKDRTLSLAETRYLMIDEADSLFDAGWGDDCRVVIRKIQDIAAQHKFVEKIIIVSATLPRSVHSTLDQLFPKILKITTPSLHRALPNLKQSFIDLQKFNGNRQLALLEVLKKNIKDKKTLIFCNTKKSVELLHRWLETKNINALALYKDAPMSREECLALFSKPVADEDEIKQDILISTDIASRGIDTTFVDHVILYDFPDSVVDYLHRVGRTARAGQTGKATSLIGRKDRMLSERFRRSIRDGTVLT